MFKIYLRATVSFYVFFMQQYTAIVRDVYSYESKGSPLNKIWLQVVTRDISVMPMPRVNTKQSFSANHLWSDQPWLMSVAQFYLVLCH